MEETQEKMLEEYEDYLKELVAKGSGEIFTNGGIRHASVLMSVLLGSTTDHALIFSEGFCPDIIQEPYLSALERYADNKQCGLKILLESDRYVNADPIRLIREKSKQRIGKDKRIEIRLIREDDKIRIFRSLNCAQCNFSVFDDRMYRFEYDPKHYKAYGSFNHVRNCAFLTHLFNEAFVNAQTTF